MANRHVKKAGVKGSRNAYGHGCRCAACTHANAIYMREYMRHRRANAPVNEVEQSRDGIPEDQAAAPAPAPVPVRAPGNPRPRPVAPEPVYVAPTAPTRPAGARWSGASAERERTERACAAGRHGTYQIPGTMAWECPHCRAGLPAIGMKCDGCGESYDTLATNEALDNIPSCPYCMLAEPMTLREARAMAGLE
jgi:hypothetical protein